MGRMVNYPNPNLNIFFHTGKVYECNVPVISKNVAVWKYYHFKDVSKR